MHPGLQLASVPVSPNDLRRRQPRVLFLCSGNNGIANNQCSSRIMVKSRYAQNFFHGAIIAIFSDLWVLSW